MSACPCSFSEADHFCSLTERIHVVRALQWFSALDQHTAGIPIYTLHIFILLPSWDKLPLHTEMIVLFSHFLSPFTLPFPISLLTPFFVNSFPLAKPFFEPLSASDCCSNSPSGTNLCVFLTTHSLFISLSEAGIAFAKSLMTTDLPNSPRHLFQTLASSLYPMKITLFTNVVFSSYLFIWLPLL